MIQQIYIYTIQQKFTIIKTNIDIFKLYQNYFITSFKKF